MQGDIFNSARRMYSTSAPADSAPARACRKSRSLLPFNRGLAEIPSTFIAITGKLSGRQEKIKQKERRKIIEKLKKGGLCGKRKTREK